MKNKCFDPASFKDPTGRVYWENGKLFRSFNEKGQAHFIELHAQRFYESAVEQGFLLDFEEIEKGSKVILAPRPIEWISYPYEWTPAQLKDAALFHLEFLTFCIERKVMIKDATPFNLQLEGNQWIFIDHGSFEPIQEDFSWKAYKQFCETFVGPLLISRYCGTNACLQFRLNLEGIKLEEVQSYMPFKALFDGLYLFHVKAHAFFNSGTQGSKKKQPSISKAQTLKIIRHLKASIESLTFPRKKSNWSTYQQALPYRPEELEQKKKFLAQAFSLKNYQRLIDIGANHSDFLSIYPQQAQCILIDQDFQSVESLYHQTQHLCLVQDITQPSPALGLHLQERKSFGERMKVDLVLGLALIHHLFHGRNLPMNEIAKLFAAFKSDLIIEFVGPADEQYQFIENPENHHPYTQELFELAFSKSYRLLAQQEVKTNKRWIYHYQWAG